jgi:mono/diheme cytochrome c family protein
MRCELRIRLGKLFRWIGTFLVVILGVAVLGLLALYYKTNEMIYQTFDVKVQPLKISMDQQSIERGRQIVTTRGGCTECHTPNLSGQVYDEGILAGRLVVANLTSGKGGVGAEFSDEDWVRAIRYGLKKDGTSLLGMPSEYFNGFSDADLAAIIAYLRSLPPVDTNHPQSRFGPLFRWLIIQEPHALPAHLIDFKAPRPPEPVPGVTAEYGKYLSITCHICHLDNMAGGTEPGQGLNLTPGGDLATWTEEDFLKTIRTGVTPSGKKLDPSLMPWQSMGKMSDDELKAIWLYLQSLPPVVNPTPTPTQ